MKSRILSAALATVAVVGGTLRLTGTASAQPITAPATVMAEVQCENGRGFLVVTAKNNSGQIANLRLRSQYGNEAERRVGIGQSATFRIATQQIRVGSGTVDVVTRANGTRQSEARATYPETNCRNGNNIRKPQISAWGVDYDRDRNINTVFVRNNGRNTITVWVRSWGDSITRTIEPGRVARFRLDDRSQGAWVTAQDIRGGEKTNRLVRL